MYSLKPRKPQCFWKKRVNAGGFFGHWTYRPTTYHKKKSLRHFFIKSVKSCDYTGADLGTLIHLSCQNHPKSALGSIGPVLISLSQVRDVYTTNSSHFQGKFTNTQNVGPVVRIQSTIFPRKSTTGYLGKICVVSETGLNKFLLQTSAMRMRFWL